MQVPAYPEVPTNAALAAGSPFMLPVLPEAGPAELTLAVRLLHRRAGIVLGKHRLDMAARTLGQRTRALGLDQVRDYLTLLEHDSAHAEWQEFINAFTINHSGFFREAHHFEALARFARTRKGPVAVWSSAASTGEEPYSIALTLLDARGAGAPGSLSVLATDIDTGALQTAERGVYTLDRVKPVPAHLLTQHFLRGAGRQSGKAMVKRAVRDIVRFERLNLVAPGWPIGEKFDAIFCRNTLIYFDHPTQTRILERFAPLLKPGGLLFAGHSENLTSLTRSLRLVGQTVYALA